MRVVAIDPGYDRLGVAVMELSNTGTEQLLFSTCIETDRSATLAKRTYAAGKALAAIIDEHQPDTLAIETLFFNKNQKTAIGVAGVRGMVMYIAQERNCQVVELSPQEIKVAVTGYGKSDKQAVISMVTTLVPSCPPSAYDDEYDAIAIAITCLAIHGRRQ